MIQSDDIILAWPQLSQKALVDFVNGTESAGELIRFRSKRTGLLGRLGAFLSGRDGDETQLIYQAMITGQATTIDWLTTVQNAQAESDIALAAVARATKALRAKVGEIQSEISDRFEILEKSNRLLYEELADHSRAINAKSEFERILIEAEQTNLPTLAMAFYVVDCLWWGPFGNYIRQHGVKQKRDAENSLVIVRHELKKLILRQSATKEPVILSVETLATELNTLNEPTSLMINFLSAGATDILTPLHYMLGDSTNQNELPKSLPRYASADRLSMRMWSETKWLAGVRSNEKP